MLPDTKKKKINYTKLNREITDFYQAIKNGSTLIREYKGDQLFLKVEAPTRQENDKEPSFIVLELKV